MSMKQFLREYWLYVAVPLAILFFVFAIVALTADHPGAPFQY